ncbi:MULTISPECIES: TRAP transporter large permease subunit [Aphanizomenon]|uniref:TRAP transporter large permease n=1 Tax=Aphanizomenon TaxID=1175 RepID=UPI0005443B46|nr:MULTISPECIES: TRAP transporter large permease subunit [Aphanizomenon]KHG43237.1 C4-dicarboxylate ABC transporter [Aphanizomenon flos-aquae 2012/KM1/D3]MTJ29236.1 TRAP transporter large permease subunit [Aphanizomenon sp. UHCC 0183]QSV73121.1 MAG: TRAP transporter large permease subunit [Aphanizomenon flos-aquae KM1D3_PB]
MGSEWLAILMFVGFFFILMSGFPVAFSFAGTAIVFGLIGTAVGSFNPARLLLLPNSWFGTMSNFTLLAIPFFVFLGAVLEKSGLAEELLETIGIVLSRVRGGLALAVVLVGTVLAATTGVVAATVIVMGMLSLPLMLRYGYDKKLASGVIIASGTLAQLIPPSLVLVILSDQIGVSVGDLFLGALIPGLMLSTSYILYILGLAFFQPEKVPLIPDDVVIPQGTQLIKQVFKAVVPPIILIFAVLGSIFFGVATPTEAGAVGAVGASILAAFNKRLTPQLIRDAAHSTAVITALVVMILFCSSMFSLVFDALGGKTLITNLLIGLPGGYWGFLIVSNIVIFILGAFLEFIEICFIAMPLLVPAAQALNIDMVWFGVVMAVNLQTAFISPPVGFSLFYLQSVAPKEVSTLDIHKSAIPFIVLQFIVLLIVIAVPQTVRWLIDISATTGV